MNVVGRAHAEIAAVLRLGAVAVDGTAGNGHDTLALARRVGDTGRVFAFEIQEAALVLARTRLADAGLAERVTFFHAGHEAFALRMPRELRGRIDAAMFNLGYCPGGDKRIVTRPDTTVAALTQVAEWLAPGGVLTIAIYPGHLDGELEKSAVLAWAIALPREDFIWRHEVGEDVPSNAPSLLVVTKLAGR